jgi:hypothetical protein
LRACPQIPSPLRRRSQSIGRSGCRSPPTYDNAPKSAPSTGHPHLPGIGFWTSHPPTLCEADALDALRELPKSKAQLVYQDPTWFSGNRQISLRGHIAAAALVDGRRPTVKRPKNDFRFKTSRPISADRSHLRVLASPHAVSMERNHRSRRASRENPNPGRDSRPILRVGLHAGGSAIAEPTMGGSRRLPRRYPRIPGAAEKNLRPAPARTRRRCTSESGTNRPSAAPLARRT